MFTHRWGLRHGSGKYFWGPGKVLELILCETVGTLSTDLLHVKGKM